MTNAEQRGAQRLSLEALHNWESWKYGMFIHFGMSTFDGKEHSDGNTPAAQFNPAKLDVEQWIRTARDAGMTYAILTAKHTSGHCLWPSQFTNYSVANSPVSVDIVKLFVEACRKYQIRPGFYYCSWDNHHRFGSRTISDMRQDQSGEPAYTTSRYQTFQTAQITELLTQYGEIAEMWVDIPPVLGRGYRTFLYDHIARLQPNCIIMMNNGWGDGSRYPVDEAWPSDIMSIEFGNSPDRALGPSELFSPWREIEGRTYYLPGEVCDYIGGDWFFKDEDQLRPDSELQTLFENCRARGTNLLLNVPPDRSGVIPPSYVEALLRLKKNVHL
jgi:alpha-L-fucosidase